MSHDEIRLNYDQADEMAKTFRDGSKALEDTMKEMKNIADALEEGALLGRGGSAFAEAITSKLCPSIAKLSRKFTELEGDVREVMRIFRIQTDPKVASKFDS